MSASQLAEHAIANGLDDVPAERDELTNITKRVFTRLKPRLGINRTGPPSPGELEAGLMLLHQGIVALMGDYVVVLVAEGGTVRQERVPIDRCHASLQQPPTDEGGEDVVGL